MKPIAIDLSNFEEIIKGGGVYVDKTYFIYKIISSISKYYFLSRPRRFGKSLTVSTLKAIFEGKRELFNGLYISKTDWQWEKYPIIQFDFNGIPSSSNEILIKSIDEKINEIAKKNNIKLSTKETTKKFKELILKLNKRHKKGVVILVDEYDKPIINHLGTGEERLKIGIKNREFLKEFYDNLKEANVSEAIKLVFITGVSKFSKVSIFSALNNLIELDIHPEFSAMLGYTQEELEKNFQEHLEDFSKKQNQSIEKTIEEFKYWYDGFRFTEKEIRVYNPFSIGRALSYGKIDNYWFDSGTPTFLINLIKEKKYYIPELKRLKINKEKLRAYEIEKIEIEPLLYQTGYLTIKEVEEEIYILTYPNYEVERSFEINLIDGITERKIETVKINEVKKALIKGEYKEFFEIIKQLFKQIPSTIIPKKTAEREQYYHTIFYLIMNLMSDNKLKVRSEILGSDSRVDMLIEVNNKIYIIEFKCGQSAARAVKQIKEKKYAEQFRDSKKEIKLVGINFDTRIKNIKEWKIEKDKK